MKASFIAMVLPAMMIAPANAATLNFKTTSAFAGAHQPSLPQAGFIALQGALYGTSLTGGTHGYGTVFKLIPGAAFGTKATVQVLYNFGASSADGRNPDAPLASDAAGHLYGTTAGGGSHFAGTVFRLSPPTAAQPVWTETVLYTFTAGTDGANPMAGVYVDKAGNIFGVTPRAGGSANACNLSGCGTAFELNPPSTGSGSYTFHVLHSFTGNASDGGAPTSALVPHAGSLYGVAELGGANGQGTAYRLTPPAKRGAAWTESTIYNFTGGTEGAAPVGTPLFGAGGTLYGTALNGGQTCPTTPVGCGTVFALTPPAASGGTWSGRAIFSFSGGADGALPVSGVALGAGGQLYGTTEGDLAEGGSTSNYGSVFRLTPVPSSPSTYSETTLHTFGNASDGLSPRGLPLLLNKVFFGSTAAGGALGRGTVFVCKP
jgi:uncharacterized repeat protein (TIGR03803 family)